MATSMSLINISGNTPVEDPNYRYKMPRIVGKVEGRGNGIKTVLMNIVELSQSLNRDPQEITKFFGTDFGSQTTYATDGDRAIVNGAHRDSDLQSGVHKYIEGFVLCKGCRLPETRYKIKDGMITQRCAACGAKTSVDMGHKLTAFILAQYKKHKEAEKAGGGEKLSKEERRKQKDAAKAAAVAEESGESSPKDKKSKDKKSKGDGESSPKDGAGAEGGGGKLKKNKSKDADLNVFGISENSAAADAEPEEMESDSKAAEDSSDRFILWLAKFTDPAAPATAQQQVEELRSLQNLASLRPADRVIIFLGALFKEPTLAATVGGIKAQCAVLKLLAPSDATIQQRQVIAAFEWLCGTKHPELLKTFPIICKALLDEDIVEEDTFLMWSVDYARNEYSADVSMIEIETLEKLKEAAQPFIKWLEEAEDDEDDDEDDDDEEDEEEDA